MRPFTLSFPQTRFLAEHPLTPTVKSSRSDVRNEIFVMSTYAGQWLCIIFVELYWGRIHDATANIRSNLQHHRKINTQESA